MLELELVELLALFGHLLSLGLIAFSHSLDHSLVQRLQIAVEQQLAFTLTGLALQDHSFGQLLTDLNDGVQAGHGVLEDHCDLVTTDLVESFLVDLQQVLAVVNDLTGLGDGIAGLNTQNCLGGNGLTGAGLANDGQSFALGQIEVDITDSLDFTVAGAEGNPQIFNRQFCFH